MIFMRAIFIKNLKDPVEVNEIIEIDGEEFHHLTRVARVKVGDEFLILGAVGIKIVAIAESIGRNEIKAKVKTLEKGKKYFDFDIYVGLVKKDAQESIINTCVETGISNLFFFKAQRSQKQMQVPEKRLEKLIVEACKQSNNCFPTQVEYLDSLPPDQLVQYESIYIFHPDKELPMIGMTRPGRRCAIVVGPEGGFSESEMNKFKEMGNSHILSVPGNIMRAPTAVAVGIGHLMILNN